MSKESIEKRRIWKCRDSAELHKLWMKMWECFSRFLNCDWEESQMIIEENGWEKFMVSENLQSKVFEETKKGIYGFVRVRGELGSVCHLFGFYFCLTT